MTGPTRTVAALLTLTLIVGACGVPADSTPTTYPNDGDLTPPPGGVVKANLPRTTDIELSDTDLAALVAGNTVFAFDLFRQAVTDNGNVILSPHSIAAALTMTYGGARGQTAEEMRRTMSLGLPDSLIHAARNHLDMSVTTVGPPLPDDEREPFNINVANSLWGQAGYPFLDEFLALLAQNYDAGMTVVDFQTAAEQARLDINYWVELETQHRIVDLIPEGVINELTRLVLVNAIWFKANWASPFSPDMTADRPFYRLDGSEVTVPLMQSNVGLSYFAGNGFQAVRIPYAGDASMVVILPDQGSFEEVVASFGPADLAEVRTTASWHQVALSLPRFEFRSNLALNASLQALGIESAFKDPSQPGGADFTGITALRELYITDVVHQAFISVDEEGTEAAAATAVVAGATSAPPPATFTADRPFMFIIEHGSTGEILFIGQVTDPS